MEVEKTTIKIEDDVEKLMVKPKFSLVERIL